MKKDQIKISIEGQDYNVNLEKAIELGVISKDSTIKDFRVGNAYKFDNGNVIVIVDNGYNPTYPIKSPLMYNICGLERGLEVYSTLGRNGVTKEEMLEYLNERKSKLTFIKNINNDFKRILSDISDYN